MAKNQTEDTKTSSSIWCYVFSGGVAPDNWRYYYYSTNLEDAVSQFEKQHPVLGKCNDIQRRPW